MENIKNTEKALIFDNLSIGEQNLSDTQIIRS